MDDEIKKFTREDFNDEEWDWLNMIFKSANTMAQVMDDTSSSYNYLDKQALYSLEEKLGIDGFDFW